ncbi:MAG: Hpt domain-containing protein [Pseudomonadota bacterium]
MNALRAPPDARVLLLGEAGAHAASLRVLGLRTDCAPDTTSALHAILAADLALDPYLLVVGATDALAASMAPAYLLAAPRLLFDATPEAVAAAIAVAPRTVLAAPAIAGIDSTSGLKNVGADSAFYVKLLERFWHAQHHADAAFAAEAGAANWAALAGRAHSLRGSAASIGATALRGAAEQLENAAERRGPVTAELAVLQAALAEVLSGLNAYFSSQLDQSQDLLTDTAEAFAARDQLVVLLKDYSGDALDYFDSVKTSLAQLMGTGALAQLAEHIERYEFEAAREVLSKKG